MKSKYKLIITWNRKDNTAANAVDEHKLYNLLFNGYITMKEYLEALKS